MCNVRAFCCKGVPIRKGRHGKTPAYDELVTTAHRFQPPPRPFPSGLLARPVAPGPRHRAFSAGPRARALATLAIPLGIFLLPLSTSTALAAGAVALRITGSAFDAGLVIEVLDLPQAEGEKALQNAWDAVARAEREVAALASTVRDGRATLSPDLFQLVARAGSFCTWSDGASGPTGGAVYRLWAESARSGALPTPDRLEEAATTAKCSRLTLRVEKREIELLPGTELDLRGFVRGWAVDLAVQSLVDSGASNFRVELGPVTRAKGAGPSGSSSSSGAGLAAGGRGWPISLATLSASGNPLSQILLLDQAIAVADPGPSAFTVAGERILPAFDLRSGRPASGVSSVAAVTTLAADAEPLALAMSVLGANGGQLRLGSLRPKPSVLWLLGGDGTTVVSSSNWSAVRKP